MPQIKLEVRQSHVISNISVGAIFQIGGLSMVPFDIRYWRDEGEEIEMPRLAVELHHSFRKAPVCEQRGGREIGGRIPVVRFPRWLYCPKCRKMSYVSSPEGGADEAYLCNNPNCRKVHATLASMPWVSICANGHLDELSWRDLVHINATGPKQLTCKSYEHMFFNPTDSQVRHSQIVCRACNASLNLNALKAPHFLDKFFCSGKQPWLYAEEKCTAKPEVAGIGDHFVHYPDIISALDIPPESRRDLRDDTGQRIRKHPEWRKLEEMCKSKGISNPFVEHMISMLVNELNCTNKEIEQLLTPVLPKIQSEEQAEQVIPQSHALRQDEYNALLATITDYREYERFITVNRTSEWLVWLNNEASISPELQSLMSCISNVVEVTRLREVRALRGFTRVNPPGSPDTRLVPPDLVGTSSWLPAAEFFGEGVFFALAHETLHEWQKKSAVLSRTETARKGFEAYWAKRLAISEASLPAFMALHTLSHLMIREMAFECGYPAASLRERLYFSEGASGMAGVLIYLGAGEPGGSLGGLARLAEAPRFSKLLQRSIETARWCALDPVCAEHEGRGTDSLNRAACHACCLIPETSCECSNLMLDRCLVATDEQNGTGLFDLITRG
jgi:Domain of unknown function (DUF1998)